MFLKTTGKTRFAQVYIQRFISASSSLAKRTDMSQSRVQSPCQDPDQVVTGLVGLESDLKDGQMKEVMVEEQKVLLVRTQGQYSAVGSKCSHYGAPLIKGTLVGDRVRCPFHGACFNVKTGDIEEYPGLDSLPVYKVNSSQEMSVLSKDHHSFSL